MVAFAINIISFIVVVYFGLFCLMAVCKVLESIGAAFTRPAKIEEVKGPELSPGNSFVIVNGKLVK